MLHLARLILRGNGRSMAKGIHLKLRFKFSLNTRAAFMKAKKYTPTGKVYVISTRATNHLELGQMTLNDLEAVIKNNGFGFLNIQVKAHLYSSS